MDKWYFLKMMYKAEIDVMPHEALLDPQGKAVSNSMKNIGLDAIDNVRIGKHISLMINAKDESEAKELVQKACENMLVNKIMESYSFSLSKL